MRTSLMASVGGALYLAFGTILVGRAVAIQSWGIQMAIKYPNLYGSGVFQEWLKSPAYVPSLRLLGVIALAASLLLFYSAYSSARHQ